jgi:hypothetical protein
MLALAWRLHGAANAVTDGLLVRTRTNPYHLFLDGPEEVSFREAFSVRDGGLAKART